MRQSSDRTTLRNAGILLGLGLGGFFDGIVLHQILQWHHMLSSVDFFDPATVPGLKTNTLADGLFHAGTYLLTIAGLALLWAACQRGQWGTHRQLIGLLVLGWGLFNLVEGIVDHLILGIHHVNETVPRAQWIWWDLAFLIWGAAMIVLGWRLWRIDQKPEVASPPYPHMIFSTRFDDLRARCGPSVAIGDLALCSAAPAGPPTRAPCYAATSPSQSWFGLAEGSARKGIVSKIEEDAMLQSRSGSSRWWRVAALAALLLPRVGATNALAQDAASTPAAPYYSDTQGPPQPGGMANFLLYEDPDNLNPLAGQTSIAAQVSTAILEGLTYSDPDGNYQTALAAELPTLENGGVAKDLSTVTWKLKPNVLWSDGEPFTSEDVKFTWEAARDAANGSAVASEYELISDVQTPDPLTAVVKYSTFNAGYLDQFPWIVPKHATGPATDMANWDFNRNPIGTGPFKLQEWAPGEYLTTVKNENYREEGKPYLDGINFLVVPAEEARTARMIEGDGDVMLWSSIEADQQIKAAGAGESRTAPGIWIIEMRFNLSKPFDDDPGPTPPHPIMGDHRVREAITYAVNRDRIIDDLFDGRFYHIDSPFDVGWMKCQVAPFTYDPEKAKQLLDEVGWKDEDGDGIREAHGVEGVADGTPLSLMMNGYTGYSDLELTQLAIQEDLKAVGIDTKLENQEFAVIFGTWDDGSPRKLGDYDILVYDGGWFAEPGKDIYQEMDPSQVPSAETPGGDNFYRWVRQDVGEWIAAANSSPDQAVRRENFCKVADAVREDIPRFPILQFGEGSAYSYRLHGFTVSTWEYATWDAENWWVEQG